VADAYQKETSTDRYLLEDGSGVLLLEVIPVKPSTAVRNAIIGGIAAAWSLVVAVPLFAAVGLQQTPVVPPPRNDKHQEIVRLWEQPQWDAQRTKFTPDKETSADPVTFIPFTRKSTHTLWPVLEWESQRTRKTYIPNAKNPLSRTAYAPIALWPQPEWNSQATRKLVQAFIQTVPFSRNASNPITQWLQDSWPAQVTRKQVQEPIQKVVPYSRAAQKPIILWPQPDWLTQITRKLSKSSVILNLDSGIYTTAGVDANLIYTPVGGATNHLLPMMGMGG
jgi:hypothetical protein